MNKYQNNIENELLIQFCDSIRTAETKHNIHITSAIAIRTLKSGNPSQTIGWGWKETVNCQTCSHVKHSNTDFHN